MLKRGQYLLQAWALVQQSMYQLLYFYISCNNYSSTNALVYLGY